MPIQVTGENSVPGGHVVVEPPQYPHKNPSIAQLRQYSHLDGLPASPSISPSAGTLGDSFAAALATGKSGKVAPPTITAPKRPRKLRREVVCASFRALFCIQRSNICTCYEKCKFGAAVKE